MSYKICEALTTDDIQQTAKTAKEIWNEHFVPIIGQEQVDYMLDQFQSADAISNMIKDGYRYYMLFSENDIIGYCGVHLENQGRLFLSKLYIKKEFRGKGLSRKLLNHAIVSDENVKSVYLTVNKHNDNTIAIYDHIGFKIIDSVVSDIGNGFVMDDYIMELNLQ